MGFSVRAAGLTLADIVRGALADLHVLGELLGIELRSARGGVYRCPFHADSTPSFSVFPSSAGGWAGKCHGCGVRGDALALVAKVRGLDVHNRADFRLLIDQLADELRIVGGTGTPMRPVSQYTPPPPKPDNTAERIKVQSCIYNVLLDVAPLGDEGVAYLRGRCFQDDEIPNEDWCLLPPPGEQRRVVNAIIAEIGRDAWRELSGLSSDDGSRFKAPGNRLVIPWRSGPGVQSEVAYLQRRRLDGGKPKYIGPDVIHAPMPFGIEDFENDGEGVTLVLVEGALDVLAMRTLARAESLEWVVLGIPGTGSWRKEWAALGAGHDVILALDADEGGDKVLDSIASDLTRAGTHVRETPLLPEIGKDWNEMLRVRRGEVVVDHAER